MALRRRSIWQNLAGGVGDALGTLSETLLRAKLQQQAVAQQQAMQLAMKRFEVGKDIATADPTKADALIQLGNASGLGNFSSLAPSDATRLRPLDTQIQSAKGPEALPADFGQAMSEAGVPAPSYPISQLQQLREVGGQLDFPGLPPALAQRLQMANSRLNQLDVAQQEGLKDTEAKATAEYGGRKTGELNAVNANFPAALQQDVTKTQTLGPLQAQNAGLTAGAQFDAAHTPDRMAAAAKAAAQSAAATEGGKLSTQKQYGVGEFAPVDIGNAVRTTITGKKYLTLDQFTGNQKKLALDQALAQKIPIVNKDQADALSEIDRARQNLEGLVTDVVSKLPKDASGRLLGGALNNKIGAVLQTDPELASWGANRTAAIQALRAAAGSKGLRINRAEIEMSAQNDIPQITDTVATATARLRRMRRMLDNAENATLVLDRSTLGTGSANSGGSVLDRLLGTPKP